MKITRKALPKVILVNGERILVGKAPKRKLGFRKINSTDKKLKAFQQVVGMWAEKDTSFFDDRK